eukprot:gnl/TRDRNA2_/TRDRNA2_142086_c1_seq1.p1 gnl/TRDRNA2_/TRDRNA2_142086_c1~~gnl/TRDRNA2_/TRDRNA2_142086_c1_seq1.p1  ORF type:complete len:261 (+),score=33.24 gnl/TRDRNA2_/TRDRNA2_142086_c1_seq1:46-828(+)
MKHEKLLLLTRVVCAGLDSTLMPPNGRISRVLAQERLFAAEQARRSEENMTMLLNVLRGPKAANYSQYAPELQRLRISRLGVTSEAARNVLDALGLLAPSDTQWTSHAHALLYKRMLQQYYAHPHERQRLRYGMHQTRLLCCTVRVQRRGRVPVEWVTQGAKIDNEQLLDGVDGPLRSTDLNFDRGHHCELLALNQAHELCTEQSPTGKDCAVDLLVAHQPCVSCTAAMCNFAELLPHAQLRVGFHDWRSMQQSLNTVLR